MRSNIHLSRDREALGQFTPQQVANGLREGRFRASDLAWREGMESWRPLAELATELPEPEQVDSGIEISKPEGDEAPSWEKRDKLGVLVAVTQTIGGVLFHPVRTFARMRPQAAIDNALWYLLLVGTPCGVVSNIYFYILVHKLVEAGLLDEKLVPSLPDFLSGMLLLPIALTLKTFFYAAIYHGAMYLIGAGKRRFDATFRVVCYVSGSTAILELIPVVGIFFALLWQSVGLLLGLREAHQTTTGRVAVALSLPFVLLLLVLLFFARDYLSALLEMSF